MSMRFKLGELAILVASIGERSQRHVGKLVEIIQIGPFERFHDYGDGWLANTDGDYRCRTEDGYYLTVKDYHLRKLEPPLDLDGILQQTEEEMAA